MRIFWHSWSPQTAEFEFQRIQKLKLTSKWVDAYRERPTENDILLTGNGRHWRHGPFQKTTIYFEPYHYLQKEYDNFQKDSAWDLRFVYHPVLDKRCSRTALFKIPGYWAHDGKLVYAKNQNRRQFVMVLGFKPPPINQNDIGYLRARYVELLHGKDFLYWGSNWDPNDPHYQGYFVPENEEKLLYSQKLWSRGKFGIVIDNFEWEGYHSEKIWNCMLAGTLPVYYGHRSILEEVDPQCIIYGPDFDSPQEVIKYCDQMSPREYERRLNCMISFLEAETEHSWEHLLQYITDTLGARFS